MGRGQYHVSSSLCPSCLDRNTVSPRLGHVRLRSCTQLRCRSKYQCRASLRTKVPGGRHSNSRSNHRVAVAVAAAAGSDRGGNIFSPRLGSGRRRSCTQLRCLSKDPCSLCWHTKAPGGRRSNSRSNHRAAVAAPAAGLDSNTASDRMGWWLCLGCTQLGRLSTYPCRALPHTKAPSGRGSNSCSSRSTAAAAAADGPAASSAHCDCNIFSPRLGSCRHRSCTQLRCLSKDLCSLCWHTKAPGGRRSNSRSNHRAAVAAPAAGNRQPNDAEHHNCKWCRGRRQDLCRFRLHMKDQYGCGSNNCSNCRPTPASEPS